MSDSASILLRALSSAAAIVVAAYLGFAALQWLARRFSDRFPVALKLVARSRRPVRFLVGVIAAQIVSTRIGQLREGWATRLEHVLQIAIIFAIVWLLVDAVGAIEEQILKNDSKKTREPVDRRRIETQVTLVRRLIGATLIGIGVIAVLMTFPSVRSLGASLLASAGLISIIAGLAAQTSLTNVFAGVQLALSDTVRVGDVVMVNDQLGRIDQLALTHVEVRLWDGRVVVYPTSFFISEPFENWTRTLNQVGGSVFLDVDWTTPVDVVRTEVNRILEGTDLWDGRRNFVLVSATEGAAKRLQIGVSSASTDDLFALQSLVREQLIAFLLANYPASVVRTRFQSTPDSAPEQPATSNRR